MVDALDARFVLDDNSAPHVPRLDLTVTQSPDPSELRCGPFDAQNQHNEKSGPSRRSILAFGGLAAAGLVLANVGGAVGQISRAAAEPAWNHPFIRQGRVTSHFGPRVRPCPDCSADHKGLDYVLDGPGTPIYSVSAGTVVAARLGTGFGNFVEIDHGGGYSSLYAHMHNGSLRVSRGQLVPAGTILGGMGETGTATAVHLHIELRLNGVPFDPYPRLHDAPPAGLNTTPPPVIGKKKMWLYFDTAGTGYLATDTGVTAIGMTEYNLFWRVINSNQVTSPFNSNGAKPEVFAPGEISIMNAALARTRVS